MYVDVCKTKVGEKTYTRALIRESYREDGKVKKRTIANISDCSEEEIRAIRMALRHKDKIADAILDSDEIELQQKMSVGAVFALSQIAKQLKITKVLGNSSQAKLALWIIIARLICPGSKLAAVRLAKKHAATDVIGMDTFNEDHLYYTLDWAAENQIEIEKRLFRLRHPDETPEFFLYDVTNSYLEGTENELAAWGKGKDKKKGKKIIAIGLLTDGQGWPVAVEVFKGNAYEPKTLLNQIKKLADRFGCKHVTIVGDRGMVKSTQIEAITDMKFHYLTAITKPQIGRLMNEGAIQAELFTDDLCEVYYEGVRYILRKNPVRSKELAETNKSKIAHILKYCEEQNRYLQEHARAQVDVAKRRVEKKIEKLKLSKYVSVRKYKRKLFVKYDEDEHEADTLLDGCYVLKTDVLNKSISKETLHQRYKDLAEVEFAFRTFKQSLLEVRPVFVRTEAHTRGHVFLIMFSYMISKHLRERWKDHEVTISEGVDELSSIDCIEVSVKGVKYNKIPTPRKLGAQLLASLNIKLPPAIPSRGVTVDTRKKLKNRRK